jgi:hypothetical protein
VEDPNTEEAEAFIPVESVIMLSDTTSSTTTYTLRRKAAKRTEPWYLFPPRQDEDTSKTPVRKKPRLEDPLPTTAAEAATNTASPDIAMASPDVAKAPPYPVDVDGDDCVNEEDSCANDDDDTHTDSMGDAQSKPRATTHVNRHDWTPEEDAELTCAVTNTCKKKPGKEYRIDWVAIAALVPNPTERQCIDRWHNTLLDSCIDDWTIRCTDRRRRQQAEGFCTNARWQGLDRYCLAGPESNCKTVLAEIENKYRQDDWTFRYMDRRRRQQAEGCGENAWGQGLGRCCLAGHASNCNTVSAEMEAKKYRPSS